MTKQVRKPTQKNAASWLHSQRKNISCYRISAMCSFSFHTGYVSSCFEHSKLCSRSYVCMYSPERKYNCCCTCSTYLLLRNWFYWWLVHCLTPFTPSEVLRDQKFYSKLKKSLRWSLLRHEGGSLELVVLHSGGPLLWKYFHGKSIALVLLFSIVLEVLAPHKAKLISLNVLPLQFSLILKNLCHHLYISS